MYGFFLRYSQIDRVFSFFFLQQYQIVAVYFSSKKKTTWISMFFILQLSANIIVGIFIVAALASWVYKKFDEISVNQIGIGFKYILFLWVFFFIANSYNMHIKFRCRLVLLACYQHYGPPIFRIWRVLSFLLQ